MHAFQKFWWPLHIRDLFESSDLLKGSSNCKAGVMSTTMWQLVPFFIASLGHVLQSQPPAVAGLSPPVMKFPL